MPLTPPATSNPVVVPGEGTYLMVDKLTTGSFTNIGNVVSVGGPKPTVAAIKTTNLLSTTHTYRPSNIPDSGELTFSIQYDPNNVDHQFLAALVAAGSGGTKNWQLVYADAKTVAHAFAAFAGFVTAFEQTGEEVEGNVTADVTVQVTGPIVRTAGT